MSLASSSALPAELIESIEAAMPDTAKAVETRSSSAQSAESKPDKHMPFIGMFIRTEKSDFDDKQLNPPQGEQECRTIVLNLELRILGSGEPNLQLRINAFIMKHALSAILTVEEVQSLSYQ